MSGKRSLNDVLGIFSTRAAWTVMGMVGGIILARWLGPHDRGILALVLVMPSTAMTFVKLGISQSNVYFINRERHDPSDVASNVITLGILLGISVSIVVWLLEDVLLRTVMRDVPSWAFVLAVTRIPLVLIDDYLHGVLQAVGKFKLYNVRLILSETVRLVLIVVSLVVYDMGLVAAVAIQSGITVLNAAWLLYSTYQEIPFSLRIKPDLMRAQLVFGVKSYAQTLTQHLLLRLDIYMVSYFLGAAETAFYSLALRFTEMVLEIPQAIGLVLYPRLASASRAEILRLTAQTCRRTLFMTATSGAAAVAFGPWVIRLWYGEDYARAGEPLLFAAIGALAMSVFVIVTRAFTSQNQQRVNIFAALPALIVNLALNVYLIPSMGIVGAALATAIAYVLGCIILIGFYVRDTGARLRDLLIVNADDLRYFWGLAQHGVGRAKRVVGLGARAK